MGRGLFEGWHVVILIVVVVLLFGWKRLPDAARSLGRSMRIFKSEVGEMKNDGKAAPPSAASSDTVRGETVQQPPAAPSRPRRPPTPPAPPVSDPTLTPPAAHSAAPTAQPAAAAPGLRTAHRHLETASMALLRRRSNPEGRMSLGDHLRELRNRLDHRAHRHRRSAASSAGSPTTGC